MTAAPVLAAPPAPRALDKLDVGIALADGKLRDNLIGDLKRLGYPGSGQNIDDAAQTAVAVALNKPSGYFGGVPQLKKSLYDSAKNLLRDRRTASKPAGKKSLRLDLDHGWNTGGAVNHGGATDSMGDLLDLATEAVKRDGRHRQTIPSGHEPGYGTKAYRARRRAEAKQRREEKARRMAPGVPVILSKDDRSAYEITQADLDAFAQVKARKGWGRPTVKKAVRNHGWAAKGRA